MITIERVGVVVPAQNEELLLPASLDALARAAADCDVAVDVVVVLDSCSDGSAAVVAAARARHRPVDGLGIHALPAAVSNVGAARALGMEFLLDGAGPAPTWLATTDADSRVPVHWLSAQRAHAAAGASVVIGTVRVTDWTERSADVAYRADLEYAAGPHRHIHGANLSLTAAAYRRSGGFRPLACDEDVALVQSLIVGEETVVWATDLAVATSARRVGRTPAGFAGYLNALSGGA